MMKRPILSIAIVAVTALIFYLDVWTSAELVGSILFTLPIALCSFHGSKRLLWSILAACVGLTALAQLWGLDGRVPLDPWVSVVNRGLLIATLVTLTTFIHLWISKNEGLLVTSSRLEGLEKRYRAILETAPDPMVIVDQRGLIVLVNARTEQLFQYTREELVGRSVDLLVPPRFRERHPGHREAYSKNPFPRAMGGGLELFGLRKDGTELPIEISLSPLDTEDGPLVSSAIRDITDRKKADEQRFRLAAIVDSSDDAIIGETLDGIIISWNQGAERIFGYSAVEMVGQSISVLISPELLKEEFEGRRYLHTADMVEHVDSVRRRKDGSEIDVSITRSPMRDRAGKLIGTSKVARDITARRSAERALARAKDAAVAANRELEAFSYSVAHDLRAPLRGMNGFAQVLLDNYRDRLDADGQDWLQEIVQNAKKMAALIDALLSLSRVSRSELRVERVDLSSLVRTVIADLTTAEPERPLELVVADGLYADADPALARALIDNLVGNAWKFTRHVSPVRIEFGAIRKDDVTSFFVRDNGAGFDMSYAAKLFAPFQRLHSNDEFPGTGIGLATVQRIIHRHGGRISAEGAVGTGATVYFSFPRQVMGAT